MPLTMPDTWLAAQKIAGFEGFRPKPYLDGAGIPTIGYGCTIYPSGKHVALTDPDCTPTQALDWLHYWIGDTAKHLWPSFQRQPTLHQFSAFISLAYNIGWPNVAHSTAMREFNAGNLIAAADAFLLWDKMHVDGKLVESVGLLHRRGAERALFLTPDSVSSINS